MSLVDYASSDDDVPEIEEQNREVEKEEAPITGPAPRPPPVVARQCKPASPSHQLQKKTVSHSTEGPLEKLPDASLLFDSPSVPTQSSSNDHASRVAAAQASRKRDSNVPSASSPRRKLPRGTLPHMKNFPETSSGMLVPPQLSGRSNVVTEDISKLFVKSRPDPSSQ